MLDEGWRHAIQGRSDDGYIARSNVAMDLEVGLVVLGGVSERGTKRWVCVVRGIGTTVKGLGLGACVSDAYLVGVSSGSLFQPVSELVCLASYETTQGFIRHHALCCNLHEK